MRKKLLEIKGLRTTFFTDNGQIPAVDDIDFSVQEGEILGIVGESGSGKSVTSLSIMGLIPSPPGKITGGEILLDNKNLVNCTEKQMQKIRGKDIAMIFQEPMTSLNPLFTIGDQLKEAILIHNPKWSKKKAFARAVEIMKLVGLPRAEDLLKDYPHQLVCDPQVLIADEPTTALDVTIQAQILQLMKDLNKRLNTAVLLITHDLGVVAETCERVIVMYAGQIVEEAPIQEIFSNPKHPYTQGLIQSVPDMRFKKDNLYSIPGSVPKPGSIQVGCRFAARCEYAMERCLQETPPLFEAAEQHKSRCFLLEKQEVEQRVESVIKG